MIPQKLWKQHISSQRRIICIMSPGPEVLCRKFYTPELCNRCLAYRHLKTIDLILQTLVLHLPLSLLHRSLLPAWQGQGLGLGTWTVRLGRESVQSDTGHEPDNLCEYIFLHKVWPVRDLHRTKCGRGWRQTGLTYCGEHRSLTVPCAHSALSNKCTPHAYAPTCTALSILPGNAPRRCPSPVAMRV